MREIILHKHELEAILEFVFKYASFMDYINISVDSSSGIGSIIMLEKRQAVAETLFCCQTQQQQTTLISTTSCKD
jgi:hypothetical protein